MIGPTTHSIVKFVVTFFVVLIASYVLFIQFALGTTVVSFLIACIIIIATTVLTLYSCHKFIKVSCPECGAIMNWHARQYRPPAAGSTISSYSGFICTKCGLERMKADIPD